VDLTRFLDQLNQELLIAADAGGDDARAVAERLLAPLQSATRLVLLEALSSAASEITAELAPGSVEVRLRGRDPEFVVTTPPAMTPDPADPADHVATAAPGVGSVAAAAVDAEDAGTARVTLRLPEPLKLRIEEAAARDGLSVNSWLVRTLAGVVEPSGLAHRTATRSPAGGERFSGWARA
jgi:hypothetical protein